MAKCPRSGAKFLWQGQVVTAVPAGFVKGHRSNATCFKEDGKTIAVVRMGAGHNRYYPPLKELKPLPEQLRVPPLMHVDRWRTESYGFSQPVAPGVNGLGASDVWKDQLLHEYENVHAQLAPYGSDLSDPYAKRLFKTGEDIAAAAIAAGASYSEIAAAARRGRKQGKHGLQGIEETDILRLYGSCVKKCRRHAPQSLGPCIDRCQESGGQVGALFDRAVNVHGPIGPDVRARLQRYLRDPNERNWHDVRTIIIDTRAGGQTVWQAVAAVDSNCGLASRTGAKYWPDKWTFAQAISQATGGIRYPHPGAPAKVLPLRGDGLSGTDDYHAHSASMWATNAVEEAELGAGDALNKGQCNRALESLVRAERKTTMASTNATQTGNPRLKAKALASNTLVNALWREFQTKCIRRYPGDHPGSVLPFGGLGGAGLGGAGSLHERIAAVLGWSVKDTQGFSLSMLREMVREKDPQLAQETSDIIQGGGHIYRR